MEPQHTQVTQDPTQLKGEKPGWSSEDDDDKLGPVGEGEEFADVTNDPEAAAALADQQEQEREQADALKAVRNGSKAPALVADATEWFLSDKDAGIKARKTIELDVAAEGEHYVEWTVQAISRKRIRQIRTQSKIKRGRGMTEEIDDTKANLLFAVEGTVKPDLKAIAESFGDSPERILEMRMSHKEGLIDQIASEVLAVSGYDDDDVRDVAAVKS